MTAPEARGRDRSREKPKGRPTPIDSIIKGIERRVGTIGPRERVDQMMILFEEPILIDGPAEIAFLYHHLWLIVGAVFVLLLAFAIDIVWITLLAVAICVGIAMIVLVTALRFHYTKYVITTDRIMRTEGVISRQTNAIPYSKVTDLTFRQSPMDRVMSIARVRIDSANEASPFRELTDLTNHSLFMYTLSTMVNIRQAPHRSGTRQQVFTQPKKIKILDELLDQIEDAGLAAWSNREAVYEALFDDWVEGAPIDPNEADKLDEMDEEWTGDET